MNRPICIILNGPPDSGKDSLARLFMTTVDCVHLELKDKLFHIALSTSGISSTEWFDRYNNRTLKELPWDKLGGLSQRQFLIKISEEWVKPVFGPNFFGKEAAKSANSYMRQGFGLNVIFTDGGFPEELATMLGVLGEDNVLLVRLHRDGRDFSNDSRSYLPDIKHTFDLHNDSTLELASFQLLEALRKCQKS